MKRWLKKKLAAWRGASEPLDQVQAWTRLIRGTGLQLQTGSGPVGGLLISGIAWRLKGRKGLL